MDTGDRPWGVHDEAPDLRAQPAQPGQHGLRVGLPFRLDTGQVVLVDRGWVEASSSGADVLPAAPAPPTETVTLVGWALPGEASKGRKLPAGQLASINLPEAARATGEDLLGGYVRLQEERSASGDVAPAPTPLDPPIDRSAHTRPTPTSGG